MQKAYRATRVEFASAACPVDPRIRSGPDEIADMREENHRADTRIVAEIAYVWD
jgi:hypothetical protein